MSEFVNRHVVYSTPPGLMSVAINNPGGAGAIDIQTFRDWRRRKSELSVQNPDRFVVVRYESLRDCEISIDFPHEYVATVATYRDSGGVQYK
jgi:hypothetical protein